MTGNSHNLHADQFPSAPKNDVIRITKGNPSPDEIAVLASVFTVLSAHYAHLKKTDERWPHPNADYFYRGPYDTFIRWTTNLRFWG